MPTTGVAIPEETQEEASTILEELEELEEEEQ
jgi:hypothetical protein